MIEALSKLSVVVMNKTGTVTEGKYTVSDVIPEPGVSKGELLTTAAVAESCSAHPIAAALREACNLPRSRNAGALNIEEVQGRGVSASFNGKDVLVEDMDAATVHFALLFQFEGDDKATKHVLYNCTATRPNVGGTTKNESIEPQTETITITASSIYDSTLGKEIVKAEANGSSNTTTYNGWTSAVYTPTAPSTTT